MVSFGRNWPIKVKLWVIENEATKCPYGPMGLSPSAIDSDSLEPLSVLHSKLEFEW